ncbi:MAG: hypothetical protein AAGA95_18630 [Pseudomonadota bacterium]
MDIALTARRCLTATLLLTATGALAADGDLAIPRSQYLVVASVQDPVVAEEVLERAQRTIGGTWGLVPYEDERGRWQRVISGPFLTARLARSALEDAQLADFTSAWLLASADAQLLSDGLPGASLEIERAGTAPSAFSSAFEPASDRRGRSWSTRRIPERPPLSNDSNYVPPVLIQSAPVDYRLNRLERDGEALAPE